MNHLNTLAHRAMERSRFWYDRGQIPIGDAWNYRGLLWKVRGEGYTPMPGTACYVGGMLVFADKAVIHEVRWG